MRIIFIGNVDFSFHCLERVLEYGGNVVGIVTAGQNSYNSDFKDLTPIAEGYRIPVYYIQNDVNEKGALEWIRHLQPDIIFCWGISQLVKKDLLKVPPMGVFGVHGTYLPNNRGRHPIIWALVLGLKETGLTFFQLDEGTDSGPILSQEKVLIDDIDNAKSLYKKMEASATNQIREFLPLLKNNNYTLQPQEHDKANYWRKRTRSDGLIDWRMNSKAILNLIRGLSDPYPGAEALYNQQYIKIWSAERYLGVVYENIETGKILKVIDKYPVVKCYDGGIIIKDYEPHIEWREGDYLS